MVAFRRSGVGNISRIGHFVRAAAALFLSACAPSSVDEFRQQGEEAAASLTDEMRRIHSKEELQAALPKLRKKYLRIAKLALAARELAREDGESFPPTEASDELYAEIARLYELPGGRELLRSAQAESFKLLAKSD